MWHIEELKPRVGSSSRSPWTSKMAKNQAGSTTPLLAFSLTWILAQRHTDLYLCVLQEAWSLPLCWPSRCITLLEPYQLLPPWALNPKCGDSINREFLETKSRTRWQIPSWPPLSYLGAWPFVGEPTWPGPISLWRPSQKTDAHKRWNEAGLPTEMRT